MLSHEELKERFRYHSLTPKQRMAINSVRDTTMGLAVILNERLPEGREKSLAMTKLEECAMWANKAIAHSIEEE